MLKSNSKGLYNVYLSIGKGTHPNIVKEAIVHLAALDMEVYTYAGSNYKSEDLKNMDYLVVLNPIHANSVKNEFEVGRGQFNEAILDYSDTYVMCMDNDHSYFAEIRDAINYEEPSDWLKWGLLETGTYNEATEVFNVDDYDDYRQELNGDLMASRLIMQKEQAPQYGKLKSEVDESGEVLDKLKYALKKNFVALNGESNIQIVHKFHLGCLKPRHFK